MPKRVVGKFKVEYIQVMDEKGKIDAKLKPNVSDEFIKEMYETIMLARAFDTKALALQRQGRLGTYACSTGQEAAEIGSALALADGDWMLPTYRDSAAMIARKVPMQDILLYFGGDERGSSFPEEMHIMPIAIPIASQIVHATGLGWAMQMKGHKTAALVYFGDGATSRGDFHEGLNFAGVFKAHAVFFCQNNQFAISYPRSKQTMAETIAQRGAAYGINYLQVDGNDALGVYKVVSDALKQAKQGKPMLIEAITYRLCDHTTSDDASKYRDPAEVEKRSKADPVTRLQMYLKKKMLWDKSYEKKLQEKIQKKLDDAVAKYESVPAQKPEDLFNYHYSKIPDELAKQRDELLQELKERKEKTT